MTTYTVWDTELPQGDDRRIAVHFIWDDVADLTGADDEVKARVDHGPLALMWAGYLIQQDDPIA